MNFVLLGTSHETASLTRALTASAEHRLLGFMADDRFATEILRSAPAARRMAVAAEALNVSDLDAVIIDAEDPETLEIAKQLATNSIAVVLVPRASQGIEFIYQLGLIRDEQPDQFRLYPLRPWRAHPLVQRLRASLKQFALGRIHQVQFDRNVCVEQVDTQPALLTKGAIDEALLGDADLLKFLVGEFDQVTGLQTGAKDGEIVQFAVSMAGPEVSPAQWLCRGTHEPANWNLMVTGAAGNIVLSGGEDWQTVRWRSSISGKVDAEEVQFDYGPALLGEFLAGLTTADAGKWADDLNRNFDLLEGTHRSLRRRRTVELYFDTPSERSNFKTQMTAIGCSVLMLTLLTIVMGLGAGLVAHELDLPPMFMQVVRVMVFAPLFIFLILQAGIVLSKPSAR